MFKCLPLYSIHCQILYRYSLFTVKYCTINLYSLSNIVPLFFYLMSNIVPLFSIHCQILYHYSIFTNSVPLLSIHCTIILYSPSDISTYIYCQISTTILYSISKYVLFFNIMACTVQNMLTCWIIKNSPKHMDGMTMIVHYTLQKVARMNVQCPNSKSLFSICSINTWRSSCSHPTKRGPDFNIKFHTSTIGCQA